MPPAPRMADQVSAPLAIDPRFTVSVLLARWGCHVRREVCDVEPAGLRVAIFGSHGRFARMSAVADFVRVQAYPALRPLGFRKQGRRHLVLALPDDDTLIVEFAVHRVDPVRDVVDVLVHYALRTYWELHTRNEPNPRRMDSGSAIATCFVMPPAEFAWAPEDETRSFRTRWAADLPSESEALGEAFRQAVDTKVQPLAQRMANRERLLTEIKDPNSPVVGHGPPFRELLLRLGRAEPAEIESLLTAHADSGAIYARLAAWARSYPATATN